MKNLTKQVEGGANLSVPQVHEAAAAMLAESVGDAEKAAFLRALAGKGETPEEIAAFVEAFLERAVDPGIDASQAGGPLIDVCGTGGDKLNLFNVSTSAVFVLAAGGLSVVKHGNRGITSKSGGADVLEALGVRIDLPPDQCARCLYETGACFLFAPLFHPAFKIVAPVRQQLAGEGQRTVFNLLGPLLNPVRPDYQLVGVFRRELVPVFARIMATLGRKGGWAVHGTTADGRGMDEMSTLGSTFVARVKAAGEDGDRDGGAAVEEEIIEAGSAGLGEATLDDLKGGDAAENARILEAILSGEDSGPRREIVALNAAAAFCAAGKSGSLQDGLALAGEVIDSGAARERLRAMQGFVSTG